MMRLRSLAFIFFMSMLVFLPVTYAQEKKADDAKGEEAVPPAATHYLGREIAQTMHYAGAPWLTRESRDREEDSRTMLKMLGIKEGQVVCDLGAGNGFYTLPIAKAVGEKGKVFAVEIQPEMLRFLKKRAAAQKVENIEYILGTLIDPKLPEGSQDMILLVDVYHEFSHPPQMLAKMRKALKPDGRLVLLEFRAEDDNVPIKRLHKMSKKQVDLEMAANGFKLVASYDKLPWQHMLFYGKDDKDKKAGDEKDHEKNNEKNNEKNDEKKSGEAGKSKE